MKREAFDHPKLHDLAGALREIGVASPLAVARGVLEAVWILTAKHTPAGDLGRFTDRQIARAAGFEGDPEALIAALVETRWLDVSEAHRLEVHGWAEHCDDAVHRALARAGALFADGSEPRGFRTIPLRDEIARRRDEILALMIERDGDGCRSCGVSGVPYHVDHVEPISRGGTNAPENLQILCAPCNLAKGAGFEARQ